MPIEPGSRRFHRMYTNRDSIRRSSISQLCGPPCWTELQIRGLWGCGPWQLTVALHFAGCMCARVRLGDLKLYVRLPGPTWFLRGFKGSGFTGLYFSTEVNHPSAGQAAPASSHAMAACTV